MLCHPQYCARSVPSLMRYLEKRINLKKNYGQTIREAIQNKDSSLIKDRKITNTNKY